MKSVLLILLTAITLQAADLVFEAEMLNQVTYGWEIEERLGQTVAHLKEGVGDGIGQRKGHMMGLHFDKEKLKGFYHLYVPQAGQYFLSARMAVNRGHCSNTFLVSMDGSAFKSIGKNFTREREWLWLRGPRYYLTKGWHVLVTRTHEDGISIDQFRLSTRPGRSGNNNRLKVNCLPGRGPGKAWDSLYPYEIIPSFQEKTIRPGETIDLHLWLRNNTGGHGTVSASVSLPREFGAEGSRTVTWDIQADQQLEHKVLKIQVPEGIPRKEYLITLSWDRGDGTERNRELLFHYQFDWLFLGPLAKPVDLQPGYEKTAPDMQLYVTGKVGKTRWMPFIDKTAFTRTGLIDLGLLYSGRMFEAMPHAHVWGYTRIQVPRTGEYIVKIFCDDRLRIWIDGKKIVDEFELGPAIRYPVQTRITLEKGIHNLHINLTQLEDSWQMGFLFRTLQDGISDITGLKAIPEPEIME